MEVLDCGESLPPKTPKKNRVTGETSDTKMPGMQELLVEKLTDRQDPEARSGAVEKRGRMIFLKDLFLVGGLVAMNFIFPYIGLLIIPIDVHIFQRVAQPPTNYIFH